MTAEEDPDLKIFSAACRRLRRLEDQLAALWRVAAGGRFVHAEDRRRWQ
jgi:hypothetical protein